MDISIKQTSSTTWSLTDLLGRAMGQIIETPPGHFLIAAAGVAVATMRDMRRGPFSSLDDALAEIERHTRGVCRREREAEAPRDPITPKGEA